MYLAFDHNLIFLLVVSVFDRLWIRPVNICIHETNSIVWRARAFRSETRFFVGRAVVAVFVVIRAEGTEAVANKDRTESRKTCANDGERGFDNCPDEDWRGTV